MVARAQIVGRCIYCDGTDGLTREHVVPEGIGGRLSPDGQHEALVLGKASCKRCTEITKRLEGVCLGKMMGHFRAKAGMVRKDRRTGTRRVKYKNIDGLESYEDAAVSDLPAALVFPVFFTPGLISGQATGPYKVKICCKIVGGTAKALRPDRGVAVGGVGPGDYGRLLAKIGLGYAVAHFGVDGFEPLVRDFVLGKDNDQFGHWVGGPGDAPEEAPSSFLHEIGLRPITHRQSKIEYVAAEVRLFAMFGGPRNYVIVGRRQPVGRISEA